MTIKAILLIIIASLEGGEMKWNKDVYGPHQVSVGVTADYLAEHKNLPAGMSLKEFTENNYDTIINWHLNNLIQKYKLAHPSGVMLVRAVAAEWRGGPGGKKSLTARSYAQRAVNIYESRTWR